MLLKRALREFLLSRTSITDVVNNNVFTVFDPVPTNANFSVLKKFYPSITIHTLSNTPQPCSNRATNIFLEDIQLEARGLVEPQKLISCVPAQRQEAEDQIKTLEDFANVIRRLVYMKQGPMNEVQLMSTQLRDFTNVQTELNPALKTNFALYRMIFRFSVLYGEPSA